jgi:NADH-quinone oxidoreductase subunit N
MIPAPVLDFTAVAPLLVIGIGALVVLVGEILVSGRKTLLGRKVTKEFSGSILALVSAFFLALVVAIACMEFVEGGAAVFNPANPMIRFDRLASFATALVAFAALLSCLLSVAYLAEMRINHGEYYALVLLATSGMVLLVASVDLIAVFLGIELMSIPIYVLAGFARRRLRSNEAALKYFLVGSFASAILLYGMALLYGATGSTQFEEIRAGFAEGGRLAQVGLALVLVGFTFKISSVPFHQWAPDVYEGAPTTITAYMSVTVKAAAFVALLRVFVEAFGGIDEAMGSVFWVLAALTMVLGNLMAIVQDNVKRLLAYSSIAHTGYLLIAFVVGTPAAYSALLFYLLVYVFMNLGAFAVIVALAQRGEDAEQVEDFAGLARTRPGLAALMTLFMVSLAGIPGTAGFMAKFQIFMAAVGEGYVGIAILMALLSVVSVYYYLRLPIVMYMREPGEKAPRLELSSGEWTVLAVCGAAVLVLGIFPNSAPTEALSWLPPALDWSRDSVVALIGHAR